MRCLSPFRLFSALILLVAVLYLPSLAARADQLEAITGTITMASGATSKTIYVTLAPSIIKDVEIFIPKLGTTDSTSLTMRLVPFSSAVLTTAGCEITPTGWADYRWASTAQGTTVSPLSSAASIPIAGGRLKLVFKTKTAQAAIRRVPYMILRQY